MRSKACFVFGYVELSLPLEGGVSKYFSWAHMRVVIGCSSDSGICGIAQGGVTHCVFSLPGFSLKGVSHTVFLHCQSFHCPTML